MSNVENPYAFPAPDDDRPSDGYGMTLRDWFAGQWLAGCLSGGEKFENPDGVASEAYGIADAMLAARTTTERTRA